MLFRSEWDATGAALVDGSCSLRELNRILGLEFPLDGPKTLNGLILEHLREIPEPGATVEIAGHPMKIVQTQDRIIKAINLAPPSPASRPAPPP